MERAILFLFVFLFTLIWGIILFRISLKKEIYYLKQAKNNEKARRRGLQWFVWGIRGSLGIIGSAIIFLIYGVIAFGFNKGVSEIVSWIIFICVMFPTFRFGDWLLKHLYKKYY